MGKQTIQGRGLVLLAACVMLASCGPRGNDPPTDAEMLTGLQAFWRDGVPSMSRAVNQDFAGLLKPVAAKAVGQGVTEDSPMGKVYGVQVAYTFEAQGDFTYVCDAGVTTHIQIGTNPSRPYPNIAHSGDTISCAGPVSFTKVDQGWIMNGVLLKR